MRNRAALTALLLAFLAEAGPAAAGDPLECPGIPATVEPADDPSARIACEAAAGAMAFLRAHGFAVEALVPIEMVGELAGGAGASAVGQFNGADGRVRIRSFAAVAGASGEQTGFGVPMTVDLYRSFIAHEVAHAVAQRNFSGRPSLEAHEYIGCVVQLAVMPPELRERVLAAMDTHAFARDEEIGGTLYLMAPGVFAARAWLHFQSPGNGDAFLQRLREGRFRPPR